MFDELIGNGFGSGSEDCLHMNIYVPKDALSGRQQLPVYVYFHGGAFLLGSNADIDGTKIAREQNLIIAIVNYRLGVFGFWFSFGFRVETFDSFLVLIFNFDRNPFVVIKFCTARIKMIQATREF